MRSRSAPIRWLSYGSTMSAEQRAGGIGPGEGGAPPPANGLRCILSLSGEVLDFTGVEPPGALAAAAGAMARDADRAARHLGFARWQVMVVESPLGVLGFAPSGPDGDQLAVIGFAPETPAGAVQRSVSRLAAEGVRN